jgi:protein MpaA
VEPDPVEQEVTVEEPQWVPVTPKAKEPRVEVAGFSTRKQPIYAEIFEGSNGTILILGGIHGNEPISSELMDMLTDHLRQNPDATLGRTVILVNRANPDGLADNTRENSRSVDLNRNFPAANFKACLAHGPRALSEPETRALKALVRRYSPDAVVSLHGPLDCIDPDGGANSTRLARKMARVSPLRVDDLRAYPGSMGSYCGDTLGMAMVTYELDRKDVPAYGLQEYLEPHLPALLVAIREAAPDKPVLGQ